MKNTFFPLLARGSNPACTIWRVPPATPQFSVCSGITVFEVSSATQEWVTSQKHAEMSPFSCLKR